MSIGWEHPKDLSQAWEGINDGDMEHFVAEPLVKSAREAIQNSLDAKHPDSDKPVKVTFKLFDIKASEIPNIKDLKYNIEHALSSQKHHKPDQGTTAEDTIKIFTNALKVIKKDKISVFQIEDFNTTGMNWDEGKNSQFFNYIKAKSYSQKSADDLGSFGIGKLAPFVVSDLRTIFASSVCSKDGEIYQVTQGKSKFSTLYDDNEKPETQRMAVGWWGEKNGYNPVFKIDSDKHKWIQKSVSNDPTEKDVGTVISTLGFNGNSDGIWDFWIVNAVLMSFFAAIYKSKLEVKIFRRTNNTENHIEVNKRSIDGLFNPDGFVAEKIKQKKGVEAHNWEERFICASNYLNLLKSGNGIEIRTTKLPTLGLCELRVRVADNLPRKVCYMRDGMKITENLSAARVKNFSDLMEFVAIFECQNSNGKRVLREMENPSHDSWDPERPKDQKGKDNAQKALNEIGHWVRTELNRIAKRESQQVKDIDAMIKYGFFMEGADKEDKLKGEINPTGQPARVKMKEEKEETTTEVKGRGNEEGEGRGGGSGGGGKGNINPNNKGEIIKELQVENFRVVRSGSPKIISIYFTPKFTGKADLFLYKSMADIKSANTLAIEKWNDKSATKENMREETYIKGQRCEVKIQLADSFEGSFEARLFEVLVKES